MKISIIALFLIWKISFLSGQIANIDSLKQALTISREDTNRILICQELAYSYAKRALDSALIYADKGIQLSKKLNYQKGEALCLMRMAIYYRLSRVSAQGMQYALKALALFEKQNDTENIILCNLLISWTLEDQEYPRLALGYVLKITPIAEQTHSKSLHYCYSTLCTNYKALNILDSALVFGLKAEILVPNDVWNLTEIGEIYLKMPKIEEAQRYYNKALNKIKSSPNTKVFNGVSNLYAQKEQLDSAIFFAKKALEIAKERKNLGVLNTSATLLTKFYKKKGLKDSMSVYMQLTMTTKDSLNKREKDKLLYVLYNEQLHRQEIESSQLQYEKQVQIYFLLTALALFSLIAFIFYRNNKLKQRVNSLLQEQKKKLESTLAELESTQNQLIEKEQIASLAAVRLQELDAVKTRLYTNITHEFRTPLTVILGMAQQIKDKPAAYLQECLNMITRNGQNLLNLVNQMLDLSKLESGHLSLHYQQGDVVNFLKYIVESLHSLAESKSLQIHFISDLEQLTMDYDEMRLQQVVSNLLSNAVKFTPKGGNIYVSLSIQSNTFSFKVKDTGIGIAEADLPYIFDRFYQVDDSVTRHGEGTGIGLSLTRELVKLMNGTISVKSQVNRGTEFEVVLPIHHRADIKAESAQLPLINSVTNPLIYEEEHPLSNNDETTAEKPLVLIADDNADVRGYIASCLSADYNLLIAKDGQECEELSFEHTPDLIISDVMMPFKDGFEVCKTLKTDERTSHIPIIMLTAKADMDSKLQGLEHGADVYLMKPFNKEELLLRIKKLLELRQQLQQYYRSTISDVGFGISVTGSKPKSDIPNPKSNNADNAFVIKVRTMIEANLNNADFDVETLCHNLLLSPSQVYRKLIALTGLSTNNFIRYVRLVKAKDMLIKNSHYSISAVAYDSGFNDPAYFSRAFKQEFGMTPQAWREQNIE